MNHLYINIAICGGISSGKSTLVNALLGKSAADIGIGRTTTDVTKYEMPHGSFGINDKIRVYIYDFPEDISEYESTLKRSHLILHMIDFTLFSTGYLRSMIWMMKKLKPMNKVIHLVSKGDAASPEYPILYQELCSLIKSQMSEFQEIMPINPAAAYLANVKLTERNKSQFLCVARAYGVLPNEIEEPLSVNAQDDYIKLVKRMSEILGDDQLTICMNNAIGNYRKIKNLTIIDSANHVNDIKQICELLDKPFDYYYLKHINDEWSNVPVTILVVVFLVMGILMILFGVGFVVSRVCEC